MADRAARRLHPRGGFADTAQSVPCDGLDVVVATHGLTADDLDPTNATIHLPPRAAALVRLPMRSGPGSPSPSAPSGPERASTSPCSPRTPSGRAVPLRRRRKVRGSASDLPMYTAHNWHGFVPGSCPGTRYGYRVHGPYEPTRRDAVQPGPSC